MGQVEYVFRISELVIKITKYQYTIYNNDRSIPVYTVHIAIQYNNDRRVYIFIQCL